MVLIHRACGHLTLAMALAFLFAFGAKAERLNVRPVMQQTPVWCWAATAEMVLRYYGLPNVNPAGNYQCGVVGSLGGMCSFNCGACVSTAGAMQNLVFILNNYAYLVGESSYFAAALEGELSEVDIIGTIDRGDPVIAGISAGIFRFPSGLGLSEHVVVITGYEEDASDLYLYVNDPYPYPLGADPYLRAGGKRLRSGQYLIHYSAFLENLHYRNSIVF